MQTQYQNALAAHKKNLTVDSCEGAIQAEWIRLFLFQQLVLELLFQLVELVLLQQQLELLP